MPFGYHTLRSRGAMRIHLQPMAVTDGICRVEYPEGAFHQAIDHAEALHRLLALILKPGTPQLPAVNLSDGGLVR